MSSLSCIQSWLSFPGGVTSEQPQASSLQRTSAVPAHPPELPRVPLWLPALCVCVRGHVYVRGVQSLTACGSQSPRRFTPKLPMIFRDWCINMQLPQPWDGMILRPGFCPFSLSFPQIWLRSLTSMPFSGSFPPSCSLLLLFPAFLKSIVYTPILVL